MGWAGGPAGRQGSPDVDQQDGSGSSWRGRSACNVKGLCKGLPIRLDTLKSRQGDRLKS